MQAIPTPPPPPTPPGNPIPVIAGQPVTGSPQEVFQAFRAARRELGRQMESLEDRRGELSRQLQDGGLNSADRQGLEQRIKDVDARITSLDQQIAAADAQVAKSAAIPGAAAEPPSPPPDGPPEGVIVMSVVFMLVVFLPLSIAFARRLWRRGAAAATTLPKELMDRLLGLEQSVGAIAEEVERIGEGQRFMTRAFNEQSPALGAAREPVEVRSQR